MYEVIIAHMFRISIPNFFTKERFWSVVKKKNLDLPHEYQSFYQYTFLHLGELLSVSGDGLNVSIQLIKHRLENIREMNNTVCNIRISLKFTITLFPNTGM